MHEVIITATCGIWLFGSTNLYLAVSLWYSVYITTVTNPHHFSGVLFVCLSKFIKKFCRICLNHTVEHILYLIGRIFNMTNNKRVQTNLMNQL